jgi:hypothetical protein
MKVTELANHKPDLTLAKANKNMEKLKNTYRDVYTVR